MSPGTTDLTETQSDCVWIKFFGGNKRATEAEAQAEAEAAPAPKGKRKVKDTADSNQAAAVLAAANQLIPMNKPWSKMTAAEKAKKKAEDEAEK